MRKDEIVIEERGLYVESWLPERRSRRRPLYLLHGELGGSWLWERYLRYFAQRGWEGHALNLRAHFWSDTADFEELDFDTYLEDAEAGLEALGRPAVVVGHGLGGLLAMKLAERREVQGLVLLSPALPRPIRPEAPVARRPPRAAAVPARAARLGRAARPDPAPASRPDASRDVHAGPAPDGRRERRGPPADAGGRHGRPRAGSTGCRCWSSGAGVDRMFPETESERLAEWLGAEYQPFGAHSHYGLVIGEESHEQVADAVRGFLEHHRL